MSAVTEAWARIEAWLTAHAPASAALLAPPADRAAIAATEAAIGVRFPDDLVESLLRHDGLTEWGDVLPEAAPLSAAGIAEHYAMCLKVAADDDGLEVRDGDDEPWWHPLWVPFAESNGDAQVIDLRPGPDRGQVGIAGGDDCGDFSEAWPSLGDYLLDVADALECGEAVGYWHPYLLPGGELWWGGAGETELNGQPLTPVRA